MHSEPATMLRAQSWFAWAIVGVALVVSAVAGLATTYVLAALALIAPGPLLTARARPWAGGTDSALFVTGFMVILGVFAITAKVPGDLLYAINFIAFLTYVPLAAVFDQARGRANALRVAWLALAGVGLAFAICLVEVYGLGFERAPGINSDTIRFANTAVIVGFLALIGFLSSKAWWRVLFLAAPFLALGVVLLTGTRIAMVASPVVALVALMLIVRPRWRIPTAIGLVALLAGLGYLLSLEGNRRFLSIFDTLRQIFSGERVADTATRIRLELYEGAWQAVQQSPIVGHGWARMMSSVSAWLAPDTQRYAEQLVHLHNDLLTFGVAGGIVAILVYLGVLIAPVVLVIRSPKDSQKPQRILAIGTLVACYAVMGLTDTMIAFEMNTMLYAVLVAAILHLCRDGTPSGAAP